MPQADSKQLLQNYEASKAQYIKVLKAYYQDCKAQHASSLKQFGDPMTMAYFSDRFGSSSQRAKDADQGTVMGRKVKELAAELKSLGVALPE